MDYIFVKDLRKDGDSAVINWETNYGRYGQCETKLGKGVWGVCNKEFAEDRRIDFTENGSGWLMSVST